MRLTQMTVRVQVGLFGLAKRVLQAQRLLLLVNFTAQILVGRIFNHLFCIRRILVAHIALGRVNRGLMRQIDRLNRRTVKLGVA